MKIMAINVFFCNQKHNFSVGESRAAAQKTLLNRFIDSQEAIKDGIGNNEVYNHMIISLVLFLLFRDWSGFFFVLNCLAVCEFNFVCFVDNSCWTS
jgi:hypothetical protein